MPEIQAMQETSETDLSKVQKTTSQWKSVKSSTKAVNIWAHKFAKIHMGMSENGVYPQL